jgi:hypothetical protein
VKRECYTLGGVEGQTKETFGVRRSGGSKLAGIVATGGSDFGKRVHDPGGLVPLPAVRHGRQVGRIGFEEQSVSRHQSEQIVGAPFLERHDATERDAPACIDRELGQGVRASVAMQYAHHAGGSSFADERACVVLGVAGVNDDSAAFLSSERELSRESGALRFARRVVVVVVETALANSNGAVSEVLPQSREVALGIKRGSIVRMDASRPKHESGVGGGVPRRGRRRFERFADANDGCRARRAGAGDYRVAVAGERRVREVGVAVDEDWRAPVLRGHLRSIQRSTGAAT